MPRLRFVEWLQLTYFGYAAGVAAFRLPSGSAWKAAGIAVIAALCFVTLSRLDHRSALIIRDWLALAFVLLAYRQMDWFTPAAHPHIYEPVWVVWDRWLLDDFGLRAAIESLGAALPYILEACYLVVYLAGPFCVSLLYTLHRAERVPMFLAAYVAGALASYACFPYFPSEPPRVVFPSQDLPNVATWLRASNLRVLGGYGIHSSVLPSAHVSSTLAAALGLLAALPEKRWIGRCMVVYALLVAVATVYGRYHYTIDAVAGLAIGCLAALGCRRYAVPQSGIY